jgi:dipeptidase
MGREAWLMELIGKGAYEKGAVWVATRVPEGAVLAHANQARTTTFRMDDPKNVRFSTDVVSFARKIGRFPTDAPDDAFDFTAAYDPVTFSGARHGDARVWDLYRRLVGD